MKALNRILSFVLAVLFIAAFYVFAVLLDTADDKQDKQFVVEMAVTPLSPMEMVQSQDPQVITNAFGAPLPLPEGFVSGKTENTSYHSYQARQVVLQGEKALVTCIRPASAAPKILDKELVFISGERSLLGYPLAVAETENGPVYSLMTEEAAFLITPLTDEMPGGFSLMQIKP